MTHLQLRSAATRAALLFMLPLACAAQGAPNAGYVQSGNAGFVNSGTPTQCWHTNSWTPALAQEPCDPVIKQVVAAPVVVAQAEPAPAVVPVPVVPRAVQTLRFSADALFGFDKAVLNPAGRTVLDEASAKLKGMGAQTIHVVGHADRIGAAAYNQRLSTERANVVRDYLVSTGVAFDQIDAKGVGETMPVTQPGECLGKRSAKVIACLQPDRRVDIDFQGTAR